MNNLSGKDSYPYYVVLTSMFFKMGGVNKQKNVGNMVLFTLKMFTSIWSRVEKVMKSGLKEGLCVN